MALLITLLNEGGIIYIQRFHVVWEVLESDIGGSFMEGHGFLTHM